jgi:DNA-binding transcriptional LysR family regulator
VEATLKARELAEPIAGVLASVRAIVRPSSPFDPAQLRRTFMMAAHDFTVLMVLAPLMSELLATAPGIDLRTLAVNAETVVDDLDRGNLDLALGAFGAMPQRFVGVARREHPRLENGRMSLEAFVDLPHDEIVSRKGRAIAVQGDVSKAEHVRRLTSGGLQ